MPPTNTTERLADYEQQYRDLAAELATIGLIHSGSVTRRYTRCATPGCKCHADPPQPHGPYYQWTAKVNGKTVTRRLSETEAELYQEWIANDRRLRRPHRTDAPDRGQSCRADSSNKQPARNRAALHLNTHTRNQASARNRPAKPRNTRPSRARPRVPQTQPTLGLGLELAEDVLEQCPDPHATNATEVVRFLFARGRLRGAQGRLQEALEDFLECGKRTKRLGGATLSAAAWRAEAALACAALGDTAEARRLAGEQLELARAFGRPRTLGLSLRAQGLVEGGESGLELLAEAVETLERSRSPLELARALSDYGAALRRAGRRVQARTQLERALDLAHHCGGRRIANHARDELIAAGAKPRRDAITGRDALTAGELRVARLAAEGLTNREIAQALFITTKTAKAHLSRVYRKLSITRRGQLAGALTGLVEESREGSTAAAAIS